MDVLKTKKFLETLIGSQSESDKVYYDLLVQSYDDYFSAVATIKDHGQVCEGQGGRLFVNPAVAIRNESHKQILNLLKHFKVNSRLLNEKQNVKPTIGNPFEDDV